jgi:hypothetical protein
VRTFAAIVAESLDVVVVVVVEEEEEEDILREGAAFQTATLLKTVNSMNQARKYSIRKIRNAKRFPKPPLITTKIPSQITGVL